MKEIKDYLPYYLGCDYWTDNSQGNLNAHTLPNVIDMCRRGKEVQLHLRRLSDMSEDERKNIWEIIFRRPFPESGRIVWIDKETHSTSKRWVMMSGVERLGIEMNGTIWADSDLNHHKYNPNLVIHYLLKQGFDLFNLIENKLAEDAKTLNQQS